ncbi:membrane protease YdiL (CAAX protease family) [Methanofollis sp. W23]|uniref:CPBP family intramembrane glutamic endopeptidase n=1 Tax=Methanofollis sp. W23 TaxID=2817849 RepID=UPI001AE45AB5|nr:CPBP family intramembrane glutamic endopeptidase [Methanofollis sp. W23]MBP2146459.1 membrane protease YdiL (CAAX protease family) [Methanofollis sp. W23]
MDTQRFHPYLVLLALVAGAIAVVVGFSGNPQNDLGLFFSAGAEAAPIFLIATLAFLALDRPRLRPVVMVLTALFVLGLALVSWIFSIAPWFSVMDASEFPIEAAVPLLAGFFLASGAAVLCLLLYSMRLRRALARWVPIDPENFVHTTAFVVVAALALMPLIPLLVIGHPPLVDLIGDPSMSFNLSPSEAAKTNLYGLVWTLGGAFLAVGLFVKRSLPETLDRLGLVRPTLRSFLFAVAVGLGLVLVFGVVDHVIVAVWEYFGWYVTDEAYTEALFSAYLTPVTAVVAAIVAGVGEEVAVRGVLQPRFGILISALVFASLHAYQYAWDGVLSVFLAGLVFALLRARTSTTVSAVTHATYDLVLFSIMIMGIGGI